VHLGFHVGVKDGLRDTVAIPQVDENDSPEVATPVHPAHQKGARTRMSDAQFAASVRAAQLAEEI
jgi:hypothetical protein